jgi:superfamily II DNA/RNA helicase
LLEENCYDKIVVFVYSKVNGNELNKKLCKNGINSAFISSDLSKSKRNKILNAFRLGQINVLISTSLLSQGVNLG